MQSKRRNRKQSCSLPKYVSRDPRKGVIYRPYLGRIDGKIQWGKRVRLCHYDATLDEIWQAYAEELGPEPNTISWLLSTYLNSPAFNKLGDRTKQDYLRHSRTIRSRQLPDGSLFGDASLTQVNKRTIRGYLDTASAPVQANRQMSVLRRAWNWTEERQDIPPNPCNGVTPNDESPRDRYVTHDEYELALSYAPLWLRIAMELSYLCRARRSEVLALTYDDVIEEGLYVERRKRSQSEITDHPRISQLIELSRSLPQGSNRIVRNGKGEPVSAHGFNSAWRRMALKMQDKHFHFHDIKAKGVSDMVGEQWAGHKSKKALAVYQRRARRISPEYD